MTREEHRAANPNIDWASHDQELANLPEMTDAQGARIWFLFFGQDNK